MQSNVRISTPLLDSMAERTPPATRRFSLQTASFNPAVTEGEETARYLPCPPSMVPPAPPMPASMVPPAQDSRLGAIKPRVFKSSGPFKSLRGTTYLFESCHLLALLRWQDAESP